MKKLMIIIAAFAAFTVPTAAYASDFTPPSWDSVMTVFSFVPKGMVLILVLIVIAAIISAIYYKIINKKK